MSMPHASGNATEQPGSTRTILGRYLDASSQDGGPLGLGGPPLRALDVHEPQTVELMTALRQAWTLLQRGGGTYAHWIQRYVQRIVIMPPVGRDASYRHSSRSIFVRRDARKNFDEIGLAAVLAHEGSHARVRARIGSVVLLGRAKVRVEVLCVQAQLEVLVKHDPQHDLVGWSKGLLWELNAALKA